MTTTKSLKKTTSKILEQATVDKVTTKVSVGKLRTPKLPALHRLIRDMSSEAYHGTEGTWSSTQLKDIIDDEEVFIQKYIKKSVPRIEREAFDTGTYFHTGVLEPHKVKTEIAFFEGKTRFGKVWEVFKAANAKKTIITAKQKEQGDGMIKAVKASPVAMSYLIGEPEISLFVELVVWKGNIHAPHFGKALALDGWKDFKGKVGDGFKLVVKCRADTLGDTFVSDLKSTSGRATNKGSVRGTISKYKYDLSASLYMDLFSLMQEEVTAFIWIFASKENPCVGSWQATPKNIRVGRAKWMWAVKRLADLSAAKWEIVDYLRDADPLPHETEWLEERELDLL